MDHGGLSASIPNSWDTYSNSQPMKVRVSTPCRFSFESRFFSVKICSAGLILHYQSAKATTTGAYTNNVLGAYSRVCARRSPTPTKLRRNAT